MKLREFANKLGVSYSTALRLFRKDEIPGAYKLPTGTIVVPNYSHLLMSADKIKLSEFLCIMNKFAKQKLKENDYKHIADIISMSSHSSECE
tara:strand:+ start:640 stop:915 length:276 start_codon:yes stop_codon:yes gene_type:complete